MGLLFSGSTGALGGGTTATEKGRGQSVIGIANSNTHFKTCRRVRGVEFVELN